MSGAPRFLGLSPLGCEIQRCAGCGYCSWDLSDPLDLSPHILETDGYRTALRRDGEHGALAFLLSQRGDYRGAAMMYLRGAWIEDEMWLNEEYEFCPWKDEIETPLSYEERKKRRDFNLIHRLAARRLRTLAIAEFLKTVPQRPEDRWLMADMLRCTGRIEEAKIQIEKLLDDPRCHKIWSTGELERILINDRIESPHIMDRSAKLPSRNVFKMFFDTVVSCNIEHSSINVILSKGFKSCGVKVGDCISLEAVELPTNFYCQVSRITALDSLISNEMPVVSIDGYSQFDIEDDVPVVLSLEFLQFDDSW